MLSCCHVSAGVPLPPQSFTAVWSDRRFRDDESDRSLTRQLPVRRVRCTNHRGGLARRPRHEDGLRHGEKSAGVECHWSLALSPEHLLAEACSSLAEASDAFSDRPDSPCEQDVPPPAAEAAGDRRWPKPRAGSCREESPRVRLPRSFWFAAPVLSAPLVLSDEPCFELVDSARVALQESCRSSSLTGAMIPHRSRGAGSCCGCRCRRPRPKSSSRPRASAARRLARVRVSSLLLLLNRSSAA